MALRQGLAADLPQSHRRSSSAMPPTLRRESADRSNVDVSYTIPLGRVYIPQGIMVATAGDYADNALAGLFLRLRTRICRNPTFVAWQTKEGICPDFLCSGSCEHVAPFRIPQFATARPLRGRIPNDRFFSTKAACCRSAYGDGTCQSASARFSLAAAVQQATPRRTFARERRFPESSHVFMGPGTAVIGTFRLFGLRCSTAKPATHRLL